MRLPATSPARLLACGLIAALAGCAVETPRTGAFDAPDADYAITFEAAKESLRDRGFLLARVDARAGVIETRPRASSGLATPWIFDESSVGEEIDGLMNAYRRRVVVRFDGGVDPRVDLREAGLPVRGEVVVELERLQRPGRRVESSAIRQTSYWSEPGWPEAGMLRFYTPAPDDEGLAGRVARDIEQRIGRAEFDPPEIGDPE